MNIRHIIARCFLCLAIAQTAMASAHAASISATARKDYGRINFMFDAPAKLQISNSDTIATLTFDTPLAQPPEAIVTKLVDYLQKATLSADKRTLTLTLAKPMRLRQFTSGNSVGIDLIAANTPLTQIAQVNPVPATAEAQNAMLTTKAPAAETPAKTTAKATQKLADAPVKTTKGESKSTKAKATPVPAAKKPEKQKAITAATPLVVASSDAILTTKKPAAPKIEPPKQDSKTSPAAAEPILSTKPAQADKPVEPQSADSTALLSTKPIAEEKQTEISSYVASTKRDTPVEPPAASKKSVAAEKSTAEPEPTTDKTTPFLVSTRTLNSETIINFPWTDRTAAAVFKRSRDIWIVFSQYRDVNAGLLGTVMPQNVVSVKQYAYKGNTVLRLVTDGSVQPKIDQTKNGFGWNVILSANTDAPKLDTTLTSDSLEETNRMILNLFDVSPAVRFYDPNTGEQLIVVPSFENGRAVAAERNFPEFSVLASTQGLAMVARQPDLVLNQTRAGLVISSKAGLSVSENLPMVAGTAPLAGASATSTVMIPYDQWYVPKEKFHAVLLDRIAAVTTATKTTKAEAMMALAKLYLSESMGPEAVGVLNLIQEQYPQYYITSRLALLNAAANVMIGHMDAAATALMAPELNELEEAQLWRQVVALYAPPMSAVQRAQEATTPAVAAAPETPATPDAEPTIQQPENMAPPKATFQYLKFNKPFIRFYPPRMRQRLAVIAADAYLEDGEEEKALAVFDVLIRDGVMDPVKLDAEFVLGKVAEKKDEVERALETYDRLATQTEDRYIAARARTAAAVLRYKKNQLTAEEAAEILENARLSWRSDNLERLMLDSLMSIYRESKQFDELLRAQKATIDAFPNHPDAIILSGDMAQLFEELFLFNLAPDMPPLKALSLFYEFRDLTPLGDKGDQMIQKLADNLASIDLLDRATQLLENQIKFRSTGASRSKIGARLGLLYLLNKQPQEALKVLEVTNFGANPSEMQLLRRQLTAQALTTMDRHDEALGVIFNDTTRIGAALRLNILWAMKDWPNIINRAEDILNARTNLTEPLNNEETEILLKLALAYAFEADGTQLRYLRDYYSALIPDSGYKQIFDFITNDTTPLDTEDFAMLSGQISRTEGFLDTFKKKIAAGKLSEAVK